MELAEQISRWSFLGQEFLTWLWFKSDQGDGTLELKGLGQMEIWLENRVTLESQEEDRSERVSCSGQNPGLKEARFALAQGKKVTKARFRMSLGEDEWSFGWEAGRLSFQSMSLPSSPADLREDPDGVFFERVKLVEKGLEALDSLFSMFAILRTSPRWAEEEFPVLAKWIREGALINKAAQR